MTVIAGRHLVAVTACVSGVAHTYMAAERLEKLSHQEKWSVNNETQGALAARYISHRFDVETFVVLLGFVAFIVIFMKLLFKLFK